MPDAKRHGAATRRRRPARRVHRHLFQAPVQGILVGAWGLEPPHKRADRFEEEA